MSRSCISLIRLHNKWQIVKRDLLQVTDEPIPEERYDDPQTAKIAGIIMAKMLGLPFFEEKPEEVSSY